MIDDGATARDETGETPRTEFDGDVRYLAENTDLSPNQARELIQRYGHDRKKLLEVARTIKAES